MRKRGLHFGIAVLVALWAANALLVTYMLHYKPLCAVDEVLTPRSSRPLSGYTCKPLPMPEGR